MRSRVLEIYRHVKEHGGYCALGAWRTAKHAALAESIGLVVHWEYDPFVDLRDWDLPQDRKAIETGSVEVFMAYVRGDGEYLASLGGIAIHVDDRDYRQTVEYELLAEAAGELLKGGAA